MNGCGDKEDLGGHEGGATVIRSGQGQRMSKVVKDWSLDMVIVSINLVKNQLRNDPKISTPVEL